MSEISKEAKKARKVLEEILVGKQVSKQRVRKAQDFFHSIAAALLRKIKSELR